MIEAVMERSTRLILLFDSNANESVFIKQTFQVVVFLSYYLAFLPLYL